MKRGRGYRPHSSRRIFRVTKRLAGGQTKLARDLLSGVLIRQSFPGLRLSCLLLVSLCLRLAHDRVENDEPVIERETSLLKQPDTNWLYALGRVRPGTNPGRFGGVCVR